MKLAGLYIDRFGAQPQLSLNDFSDQLNVVYGPNGAGKTTVIQFIRWMLFGREHDRGLTAGAAQVAPRGSIRTRDTRGEHTYDQPGRWGQFVGGTGQLTASPELPYANSLAASYTSGTFSRGTTTIPFESTPASAAFPHQGYRIGPGEFDHFFHVRFDEPRDVSALLRQAQAHGLRLTEDRYHASRVTQLSEELSRKRSELARLGNLNHSAESLRTARDEKQRRIEAIRMEFHQRQEELTQQRHQATAELGQRTSLVERFRETLASIDALIHTRREELAAEYEQLRIARRDALRRRSERSAEIDVQIQRWQEILTEVRNQLDGLRNRVNAFGDRPPVAAESTDLRYFVDALGRRIETIQNDFAGIYDNESWREYESDADYLRGLTGSVMGAMREDVSRLCQVVHQQQQFSEWQSQRNEISYLVRVEQEIADMVEALRRQRDQLGQDPSTALWPAGFDTERLGTSYDVDSTATATIVAEDFRLRYLSERRDADALRLQQAELELNQWQRRLSDIDLQMQRHSGDSQIAVLEREIREIDAQLPQFERRISLQRTIDSLESELRNAQQHVAPEFVIRQANDFLQRLTNHEYGQLRIADACGCSVAHRDGRGYDYMQLSQGVKDQVYLSLVLAIVSTYERRGVQIPLLLNDVFINLDHAGTSALAHLLSELSQRGQQTMVFTRHDHILRTLEPIANKTFRLGAEPAPARLTPTPVPIPTPMPVAHPEPVHFVPPSVETPPIAEIEPTVPDPTYRWVAEWQRKPEPATPLVTDAQPIAAPEPLPPTIPADDDPPAPTSSLALSSLLTEVPTLSEQLVELLETIDVRDVSAFLELDPEFVEVQLGDHGITHEIIQRRQREILMLVYMGISALEAQLLVACGVPDPERLGRSDVDVLLRRIETVLQRSQAAARFGTIDQYPSQRIRRWIDLAQRSTYRSRSTRSRSRNTRTARQRGSRTRYESTGTRSRTTQPTVPMQTTNALRFYLEVKDPVVDAPSIGPKTAERLHAADIFTVGDLLSANPEAVADQLQDRRISPDTLRQWQLQAQLVCRIPNLRGHDAQILVACGIEDPSSLVGTDASAFLKKVSKFVSTKEGQRVLRNGKRPDLAEVTAWIEWSENARQLRAA